MADLFGYRGADVSECGRYRYRLWRRWGEGPALTFVMLNPSTADGLLDDPTIRRCVSFAARDGFEAIQVVNLCAWRATKPGDLYEPVDIDGPRNTAALEAAFFGDQPTVVAAWGALFADVMAARRSGQRSSLDRRRTVRELAARAGVEVQCLGLTKDGHPRHPLYVKGDAPLRPWTGEEI